MKYALGYICFNVYINMPRQLLLNRFGMWVLSWAGYYAWYDHDNPELYR